MARKTKTDPTTEKPAHNIEEAAVAAERSRRGDVMAARESKGFKKVRSVTLPQFKFENRRDGPNREHPSTPLYLMPAEPYYIGREIEGAKSKMEPPTILRCIDMETGEEGELLLDTVLLRILDEEYPDHDYLGRGFEFIRNAWRGDDAGGYYTFTVSEVEVPVSLASAAAKAKADTAPRSAKPAGKKSGK